MTQAAQNIAILRPAGFESSKRASTFRTAGEWNDGDFDALADGVVVDRIMKAAAAPVERRQFGTRGEI